MYIGACVHTCICIYAYVYTYTYIYIIYIDKEYGRYGNRHVSGKRALPGRRTAAAAVSAATRPTGFRVQGLGFRVWGLGFRV